MLKESGRVLLYLSLLLPVYFLCLSIAKLSNMELFYLSDIKLFNLILSLNIVAVLLLAIESNRYTLRVSSHLWKAAAALSLLVTLSCVVYFSLNFPDLGKKAFAEWRELPLGLPLLFMLTYLCALYVPAYVLDSVILKGQWTPLEKLVFYPVISFATLGFLAVISDLTGIRSLSRIVLLLMFSLGLLHLCTRTLLTKRISNTQEALEIDVINSVTLLAVLAFSMSNLFVALGGGEANLRGDMYSDAHRVAFLSKYGLPAYFSSPSRGYPVAFSLSWLSAIRLMPFPYVNGLILIAFFNHFYFTLALYLAAKAFLRDSRRAALTVAMCILLSGFSWLSLVGKNPSLLLSNKGWAQVLADIGHRYGLYSGAIVSHIYADGHTLTRLWALGLLLAALTLLLKLHSCSKSARGDVVAFILAALQVSLGHVVESVVIAEGFLALTLVTREYPASRIAGLGASLLLLSLPLSIIAFPNIFLVLATTLPSLAAFLGVALRKLACRLGCKNYSIKPGKQGLYAALLASAAYIYGLALVAFFEFNLMLDPPIVTLWYTPAIEWGFLGLGALTALVCLLARRESSSLGLKFAICIVILQMLLIASLNVSNINFFYLIEPYPVEPILFRPFLAMIASHIAPPERSASRKRRLLLALLLAEFFAFGALNHALSASHWKWNDARHPLLHLGITEEDRELVNAIYGQPRTYEYEYVASIFSWAAPSAQLVHASGALLFPRSLGDLLSNASSKEELAIIVSALPAPFILIPLKELPPSSFLVNTTEGLEVVFSNSKYLLFSSSQLSQIGSKYNLTEFIAVSKISFNGSICIKDEQTTITLSDVVNGALLPQESGYVKVAASSKATTALNPIVEIKGDVVFHSFRSTRGYASLLGSSSAEKLELKMEEVEFKVYASFKGERMYIGAFSIKRSPTTPWFTVRPVYARWMLEAYIDRSYVNPLTVATSTPGKALTLLFALAVLLIFRKRLSGLLFGLLKKK